MNTRNESIFNGVVAAIQSADFSKAIKIVSPQKDSKDPNILRALYLIYGGKGSPYFDSKLAARQLDELDSQLDSWGAAEKGRCLLYGELYEKDTFAAEDTFTKIITKSVKAKFYLAKIYSEGLNVIDGNKVFDLEEAAALYLDVSKSDSSYNSRSLLEYCKIEMARADLSTEGKVDIFGKLSTLLDSNKKIAIDSYTSFLINELGKVIGISFNDANSPDSMHEQIIFEKEHRKCISSVNDLASCLIKKS